MIRLGRVKRALSFCGPGLRQGWSGVPRKKGVGRRPRREVPGEGLRTGPAAYLRGSAGNARLIGLSGIIHAMVRGRLQAGMHGLAAGIRVSADHGAWDAGRHDERVPIDRPKKSLVPVYGYGGADGSGSVRGRQVMDLPKVGADGFDASRIVAGHLPCEGGGDVSTTLLRSGSGERPGGGLRRVSASMRGHSVVRASGLASFLPSGRGLKKYLSGVQGDFVSGTISDGNPAVRRMLFSAAVPISRRKTGVLDNERSGGVRSGELGAGVDGRARWEDAVSSGHESLRGDAGRMAMRRGSGGVDEWEFPQFPGISTGF